jgi:hypothetical protein
MGEVGLKAFMRGLTPPVLWRSMSAVKRMLTGAPNAAPVSRVEPWQTGPSAGESLLGEDDRRFIETRLPGVQGWLGSNAAYFAAYVLNVQHASAITGPVLEIGVFAGKFLMLLHYLGRKHGNATVGVDMFKDGPSPRAVLEHARALFGSTDGLTLHEINSAELTPAATLELLGRARPRAISVDGDHSGDGVLRDLRLSADILSDRGLLILDDVLNPYAAGVAEGAYRFLLGPDCGFAPFAYVDNKTFVCRRDSHGFYLDAGRRFTIDCADLDVARSFSELRANKGTHVVEQDLLGVKVLIFG